MVAPFLFLAHFSVNDLQLAFLDSGLSSPFDAEPSTLREALPRFSMRSAQVCERIAPSFFSLLKAFLRTTAGQQEPDRLPEHDLLVQETLLRAVGTLVD